MFLKKELQNLILLMKRENIYIDVDINNTDFEIQKKESVYCNNVLEQMINNIFLCFLY